MKQVRTLLPVLLFATLPAQAQITTVPANESRPAPTPAITPEQAAQNAISKNDLAGLKVLVDANPKLITIGARNDGQTLLSRAVQQGSLEIVKYLLEKGADPNRDSYGTSPLNANFSGYRETGWKEIAVALVDKGADVNRVDGDGNTPLMRVMNYGSNGKREKVEWLISKGADINTKSRQGQSPLESALSTGSGNAEILRLFLDKVDIKRRDDDGNTFLHLATARANAEAMRIVIEKGVEVNAQNVRGDTALHLALPAGALSFNAANLKMLLDAGANPNLKNFRGDLPLHTALRPANVNATARYYGGSYYEGESGQPQNATPRGTLLAPLTDKTDINVKDRFGISPLLLAVQNRDQETRDLIIERGPKLDATTKLFDAAAAGNVPEMTELLKQKPFLVYFRLPDGTTPLHVSALWGTQGVATLLLSKGADVNARDSRGETPLMKAISRPVALFARRAKNMQALLLSKNAEVNAVDSSDSTALHRAVQAGDVELIEPLLAKNARVEMRDQVGNTPLLLAITKTGSIATVQKLLDKGANPKARVANSGLPQAGSPLARAIGVRRLDLVKLLLEKGASANEKNTEGRGLLSSLVDSYGGSEGDSSRDIFALLLEKGADPNEKYYSESLVYRVINSGNDNSREFLKLLLATKKVPFKGVDGREPLLITAINSGRKATVEMLLEAGADVNEKDSQGNSALKLAKSRGGTEIVTLLTAKNAVE